MTNQKPFLAYQTDKFNVEILKSLPIRIFHNHSIVYSFINNYALEKSDTHSNESLTFNDMCCS